MRADLKQIERWIEQDSRVLDLGCGDGSFLSHLKESRGIRGFGLEIDGGKINTCLRRGVNVLEQDIDKGLGNFETGSFDTVLLTQTLQAVQRPDQLVEEMLRVGNRCIISFPNFGYWRYRFYLMFQGRMPIAPQLPDTWYDTANIHFCTVSDFDEFCHERDIHILDRTVIDSHQRSTSLMKLNANFFGINAIYHISRSIQKHS